MAITLKAASWEEMMEILGTSNVFYVGQSDEGNFIYAPIGKHGGMDPEPEITCEIE